ncbi:amino acid transporter, partial [Staphylococcus pseudintermedius]|nr:amino acid transporter [Staphylococcus pseudintermedius]
MLQKSIFNNMLSLTSSKIFLALSLYPFLYLITLFLPTNFMQIGGIDNGLSGLDFYYGIVIAQSQFAIPLIMMSYFVSKLFYEEH